MKGKFVVFIGGRENPTNTGQPLGSDVFSDLVWPGFVLCHAKSLQSWWLFETLWTVALQAPLSLGTLQARILQWVAMPSSRGSSPPGDGTHVSGLLHWQAGSLPLGYLGSPSLWDLSLGITEHAWRQGERERAVMLFLPLSLYYAQCELYGSRSSKLWLADWVTQTSCPPKWLSCVSKTGLSSSSICSLSQVSCPSDLFSVI